MSSQEHPPREEEWNYWREIQKEIRSTRSACERLAVQKNVPVQRRQDLAGEIHAELTELERLLGSYEAQRRVPDLTEKIEVILSRLRAAIERAEHMLS